MVSFIIAHYVYLDITKTPWLDSASDWISLIIGDIGAVATLELGYIAIWQNSKYVTIIQKKDCIYKIKEEIRLFISEYNKYSNYNKLTNCFNTLIIPETPLVKTISIYMSQINELENEYITYDISLQNFNYIPNNMMDYHLKVQEMLLYICNDYKKVINYRDLCELHKNTKDIYCFILHWVKELTLIRNKAYSEMENTIKNLENAKSVSEINKILNKISSETEKVKNQICKQINRYQEKVDKE